MDSTITYRPETLNTMLTMQPIEIDELPWQPVPTCPGVRVQDLWRFGDIHYALISYAPGSSTPGKPHTGARHHIWVVSGSATIAGQRIVAGSYVYVPPGTTHPIGDIPAEGCLLLQMHRPLLADATG